MNLPNEIAHILNDRQSGSVALLNQLISGLEHLLLKNNLSAEDFSKLVRELRKKLNHFAAIENFLNSMSTVIHQEHVFPGNTLGFINKYRLYWKDSATKIAANFLLQSNPEGKTILTHSHSQTVISLLGQLQKKQIPYRILQTCSSPGEEGRISLGRMQQINIEALLVNDSEIHEALVQTDLIVMGCDALLSTEFLNKIGTRNILERAKELRLPAFLVTESRKEISPENWNKPVDHPQFEWVSLDLIDRIVSEQSSKQQFQKQERH
jgi:translation initiation factor 2B subunit (eIF-2B alpha/beta/delta family)